MLADLHMHSSCSDGRLPPEELARRCHAAGLRGISVTDHDCWDQNRRLAAADLPADLRWVPGIELSTFHRGSGRGFHVLGYGLLPDAGFERDLARLRGARRERVRGIAESLSRLGIPVDPEPLTQIPHVLPPNRLPLSRQERSRLLEGFQPSLDR
ncbi:MAG: PHP domain-containing protein [Myxococcota bacterium]|nr:PHP domain-containing protein [Myxococcota bacterium]